jgi:hypothetical protein
MRAVSGLGLGPLVPEVRRDLSGFASEDAVEERLRGDVAA